MRANAERCTAEGRLSAAVQRRAAETGRPVPNSTVPVGMPLAGATAATVAVKVTVCPNTDGLAEELRLVALPARLTVRLKFWVAFGKTPLPAVIVSG